MHFVEKVVNFDMWFVTGIYRSDDAEFWSGDRFVGDTKKWGGDFWNFDFLWFSGGQSPKMTDLDQNLDFDSLKNCEKSKFQKSPHHFFV